MCQKKFRGWRSRFGMDIFALHIFLKLTKSFHIFLTCFTYLYHGTFTTKLLNLVRFVEVWRWRYNKKRCLPFWNEQKKHENKNTRKIYKPYSVMTPGQNTYIQFDCDENHSNNLFLLWNQTPAGGSSKANFFFLLIRNNNNKKLILAESARMNPTTDFGRQTWAGARVSPSPNGAYGTASYGGSVEGAQ